jgi:hypothetical protein
VVTTYTDRFVVVMTNRLVCGGEDLQTTLWW